jgi:endonuclease-3
VTREEKARRIQRILDRLHPEAHVPLEHQDPFTLLVAVVLSAQCTDERVNRVTPALFARASTPDEMAQVSVPEIRQLIRSCGLAPSKARAIQGLSRAIVGHKTASVVRVQAFGHPAFPVDTHIHRLAGRWGLSRARNVAMTERDLKKLFAEADWGAVHLQLIYFGREHCPARGHDFSACPICSWAASKACIARETRAAARPRRKGAIRKRGAGRAVTPGVG